MEGLLCFSTPWRNDNPCSLSLQSLMLPNSGSVDMVIPPGQVFLGLWFPPTAFLVDGRCFDALLFKTVANILPPLTPRLLDG